jgi:ribosomal protein S18 acetylase RimI-like enzyme
MTLAGSLHSEQPAQPAQRPRDLGSLAVEGVGAGHLEELSELFERNRVPTVTATFDPFELTAETARRIALADGRDQYFVARGRDGLVAMSMLRGFDDGFEIPSFGIFVDHRQQGRGIGRWLTEWTISWAEDHACPAVRLSVYTSNQRAADLYRSRGFAEVERVPKQRDGEPDEKLVMVLKLRDKA